MQIVSNDAYTLTFLTGECEDAIALLLSIADKLHSSNSSSTLDFADEMFQHLIDSIDDVITTAKYVALLKQSRI